PGVERIALLAGPGTALRLPPHQAIPRVAALVVAGDDPESCARALDAAQALVEVEVDPLPATGGGAGRDDG
ncbi:MAG: hypothetical protein M3548_04265, partial [Actinomycetota bacterium]|nr:hypothetical protein [Actinomycetota bacterium]